MNRIDEFNKKHSHLICIDSDGCAIDGMTVKHLNCFGPCAIEEWNLEAHEEELLEYWNKINLYTLTRGINRFKGMLMLLQYSKERNYIAEDITAYENWVNTTKELSNDSIEREISIVNDIALQKVFSWSKKVNIAVGNLTDEEKLAFDGVKKTLESARGKADIAIISAANARAVSEEFEYNELSSLIDVCMTQEYGSKADCIKLLLEKGGYETSNVVMIGDALGDYQSAEANNVLFYPILVGKEVGSWYSFKDEILEQFLQNKYEKSKRDELLTEFKNNLE